MNRKLFLNKIAKIQKLPIYIVDVDAKYKRIIYTLVGTK
jgi:hypothetical protein